MPILRSASHSLLHFAHEHDDVPAFHAAYLAGSFLAAALFHLGFFGLLIVIHMTLDWVKYRDFFRFSVAQTLKGMFLESMQDIALFFLALTSAIYLDQTFLLATVSGLLRSELTILRALAVLLPEITILEHFLSISLSFHHYMHSVHPDIRKPFSRMQKFAFSVMLSCIVLLILSPLFYGGHIEQLLRILFRELSIGLA